MLKVGELSPRDLVKVIFGLAAIRDSLQIESGNIPILSPLLLDEGARMLARAIARSHLTAQEIVQV